MKFVQNFMGVIDKSTPHLYLSALPFLPSNSVMARYLVQSFPDIAQVYVGLHDDWVRNEHVLKGHTYWVNSVAFSPDGRHIVSGSSDQTIRVWDAQAGSQVGNPLQGHTESVNSVAFSPDGRYIVSGSRDQTIRVWDAQRGDQVGNPLQGHTDLVNSVAFSLDGKHIVSGSDDQTIRVWDAQHTDQIGVNGETGLKLSSINFSSVTTHALTHPESLFTNLSPNVNGDCRDHVHVQNDGWIVGPNDKLLLWVPLSYHPSFNYTPWTNLIISRSFSTELDLSRMCHGPIWHKCYYSSTCMAT